MSFIVDFLITLYPLLAWCVESCLKFDESSSQGIRGHVRCLWGHAWSLEVLSRSAPHFFVAAVVLQHIHPMAAVVLHDRHDHATDWCVRFLLAVGGLFMSLAVKKIAAKK